MSFDTWIPFVITIVCIGLYIFLFRIIKKKYPKGIQWIVATSPLIGFALMHFTTDTDNTWIQLKEVLIWTFIIVMIYVNIKCLKSGSKRTFNNGKTMFQNLKEELKLLKPQSEKRKENEEKDNNQSSDGTI